MFGGFYLFFQASVTEKQNLITVRYLRTSLLMVYVRESHLCMCMCEPKFTITAQAIIDVYTLKFTVRNSNNSLWNT